MTMLRPTLSLQRLVVLKSKGALYDQAFHSGLNIIRGENSSGKSTISNFICYSLGGDIQRWTPEAGAADSTHAEVIINGSVYTLSRDIEPGSRTPMYVFEGVLDDALRSRQLWLKYPYSRSSTSESFSQVLFGLMGLPELKTETHQSITIHQLLRLLYVDQITAVDEIFRHERFDNRDIRMAVGELLLGIDDFKMHDIRLRLRETERKLDDVKRELRSMFQVLGQTQHTYVPVNNYEEQIFEAQKEQEKLRRFVDDLALDRDKDRIADADEQTREIYKLFQNTKVEIAKQRKIEQDMAFDLEDTTQFIETLEERLAALDASEHMASIIEGVHFKTCPACFQFTEPISEDAICHLCKAPISSTEPLVGHLKMREELTFQLRESKRLMERRESEVRNARTALAELVQKMRTLERKVAVFQRSLHRADAEIELHLQRIGYLDRLVEDLIERSKLARLVQTRITLRDQLNKEIESLKDSLDSRRASREKRIKEVNARISELCVDVLRHDLPQEETFRVAEIVEFDFASNKMRVNERGSFSASSMTLLKNAVIISMMRLSLEDEQVRWPRFVLLDNIEDKGMQPERSANFQEFLAERLSEASVDNQVILITSMISSKLNNSPYCVGPYYTHDNKTLGYKSL